MQDRQNLLELLLHYSQSLEKTQTALNAYPWDADDPLVTLNASHVVSILARYLNAEFNEEHVEDWANAIEGRDDIDMSDALIEVIYHLANPLLTQPLSNAEAERLIGELHQLP